MTQSAQGVPQAMDALRVGQQRRLARAELFRRVRAGEGSVLDLLSSPPPEIAEASLLDVAVRTARCRRSAASLDQLGHCAVRDGVNLLVQVGRASSRQRGWLADRLTRSEGGRWSLRADP